jgi:hypothetical protein
MQSNILNQYLSNSKEHASLIAISVYYDPDEYYVGYIHDFNEEMASLQQITKNGDEDGFILLPIEQIENIDIDDEYLRSIDFVFKNKHLIKAQRITNIETPATNNWLYEILMDEEIHDQIICINKKGTNWSGFILDFDLEYLSMRIVGDKGNDQGAMLFKMSDIDSICIDKLENRKRELMYQSLKKK